jgi:hypothetical protein
LFNQILSVLPPPFNLYLGAAVKYYGLAGTILDDLAVGKSPSARRQLPKILTFRAVIVGIGLTIAWKSL